MQTVADTWVSLADSLSEQREDQVRLALSGFEKTFSKIISDA